MPFGGLSGHRTLPQGLEPWYPHFLGHCFIVMGVKGLFGCILLVSSQLVRAFGAPRHWRCMVKVSGFLGEMWISEIWKSSIQATPPHGSLRRASDPLVGSMLHSYWCLRPLLTHFFCSQGSWYACWGCTVKKLGFLGQMWILGFWKSSIQASSPQWEPAVGRPTHLLG